MPMSKEEFIDHGENRTTEILSFLKNRKLFSLDFFISSVFIGSVVIANLLINYLGKWATPLVGFVFIGLNIGSRDYLHESWNDKFIFKMGTVILLGSFLTYLVNSSASWIGIASFIAFISSSIVDTFVYQRLIDKNHYLKINGSNLFSSFTDSFLFISIAFKEVLLVVILIQFFAKFVGGLVWSPIIKKLSEWDLLWI